MMKRIIYLFCLLFGSIVGLHAQQVFDMADYGVAPGSKNITAKVAKALKKIRKEASQDSIVIRFQPGQYDFYPDKESQRMYYISNHAEYYGAKKPVDNPLYVGMILEDFQSLTLDGNGALFVCHDCMLPISLVRSSHCTIQNLRIDFHKPSLAHIKILKNEQAQGITFEVFPETEYRISQDSIFETNVLGQKGIRPFYGTVHEGESKRIAYRIGDVNFPNHSMVALDNRTVYAPQWKDERLQPGYVMLLRTWDRPAPAIYLFQNEHTHLKDVTVHYAEGMGVLAQLCNHVTIEGIQVRFKENDISRYITSMVDATHFSHCKGRIVSKNGYYENMGDDAINVHGIYMEIKERVDDHTVIGRFMYEQTWGFDWGFVGDEVQFLSKETSDIIGTIHHISSIIPADGSKEAKGSKEFRIEFEETLPSTVQGDAGFCMENLTWTPEVYFSNNEIHQNRARGALLTTPRKVVVEANLFDHVAGAAILISGDCSYWYESGACRDVLIKGNRFVNAITSLYMESKAVISIAPVIKDISKQQGYYHGGKPDAIRIVENEFDVFDAPILYAKSVDGLLFKDNVIRKNAEYPPFHQIRTGFQLEHVNRVSIE